MTLLSRVLGLIRDLAIATVFGAGVVTDVFFVAFLIPNMFRRIFAEGAFAKGFIPVFNDVKSQSPVSELKTFSTAIFWRLLFTVTAVVGVGIIFAPWLIAFFSTRFAANPDAFSQAVHLLRMMFPYLLFISIAAFFTGILNSYRQFVWPAFGPVLLNICFIFILVYCAYQVMPDISILTYAVLVGGMLHVAILVKPVYQLGLLPSINVAVQHESVFKVMKLMFPVIIGSSAVQVNQIINTQLNTSVGDGAASWFYYADRLFQFPVGMFGVAIGSVILPKLVQEFSNKKDDDFSLTLEWGVKLILIFSLPAAMGLYLLAYGMSVSLYQSGAFTADDSMMTALALAAMSAAVIGYMLVQVLSAAHYAQQDTRKPAIFGIIAVVINIIVGVSLIGKLGHIATALAVSVSAISNAVLLAVGLQSYRRRLLGLFCSAFFIKVLLATVAMAGVILLLNPQNQTWQDQSQWLRLVWLFAIIGSAAIVYLGLLHVMGIRWRQYMRRH
jgi:putative peptidoglycan lipid II flippase